MNDEQDFIYWRHRLPVGIKVEEVSGGARYTDPATWLSLARQIYCENGREGYREMEYFDNGAPFLSGEDTRISLTHTAGLLAVATLPPTPEADLRHFSERAAMGIDAERRDRTQVINVRERFLNDEELALVDAADLVANITAWTAKEAVYKAAMTPGLDLRRDIRLRSLPAPMKVSKGSGGKPVFEYTLGEATVTIDGREVAMSLFCYDSDDCRITVAYTPNCAKFGKD